MPSLINRAVTKAVFPVAGLGTRCLPATKSIPKEIMTLVDRPLIQYAIDEARAAGIEEFIFVTARGKNALEDYFDSAPHLEEELRARGKGEALAALEATNMASGAIAYVRQQRPLGLGHAVWCARRLIGDEPFAVILPDDVIAAQTPCLAQMVEAHTETGGNIVAAMEVPREMTGAYGILDVESSQGRLSQVCGMVEKPAPEKSPSTLAVIGRYILTPKVLHNLAQGEKGVGGEVQLTDAIATEIGGQAGVYGYRFEGERFDCGSIAGLLQATVAFGLMHPDLAPRFGAFLDDLAARRTAK
jgi:UTP--glucose-1-phosphate uridylyltransferase